MSDSIRKNIKKHLWYYIFFVALQIVGLALVLLTAGDKGIQLIAIILTTCAYMIWALAHQYIHHSLTAKIVIEYCLVGALGLTVSLFIFSV